MSITWPELIYNICHYLLMVRKSVSQADNTSSILVSGMTEWSTWWWMRVRIPSLLLYDIEVIMKDFKLKIVDDEVMYVQEDPIGRITVPLEVFRPNEYQARKLYEQLRQLFESK